MIEEKWGGKWDMTFEEFNKRMKEFELKYPLAELKQLAEEERARILKLKGDETRSEYFWLMDYYNRTGDEWFNEKTMWHILKKEVNNG